MLMLKYLCVFCLLAVLPNATLAGALDIGLGLSFVDASNDGFEGGWDVQVGYEFTQKESWNIGAQLQLMRGWTSESNIVDEYDMQFSFNGIYATARPEDWILYFKGGIASAQYKTLTSDDSGLGLGAGFGISIGDEKFRLHLIDYQRLTIDGEPFNVYTISLGVLLH